MNVKLQFPAGKMLTENNKVRPDLRKGKIQLAVDESECCHFQWIPEDCPPEDDFIVFPGEFSFSKVVQTKSRVFILEFQGERFFYWMQGADSSKDEEICEKVNKILSPEKEEAKPSSLGLDKILEMFAKTQKIPDLDDILTGDLLKGMAKDLEGFQDLIEALPEGQRNKENLCENLVSPQLQHALQVLSEAVRSPGGSAIFASLGLQDSGDVRIDPLERFIRAMQAKSDLRRNFK